MINNHLATLEKVLDLYCSKYEKVLILAAFNVGVNEQHMQSFCETCNLKSLIKQSTYQGFPNEVNLGGVTMAKNCMKITKSLFLGQNSVGDKPIFRVVGGIRLSAHTRGNPACCKNPNSPTCIDLILTNVPRSFQSTCVIETGLSDFHLMTLTVVRKSFKKIRPRIINFRCFKQLSSQ